MIIIIISIYINKLFAVALALIMYSDPDILALEQKNNWGVGTENKRSHDHYSSSDSYK